MTDDLSSKGETEEATPRPWGIKHLYNVYGDDDRLAANTGGSSDNRVRDGGASENAANARLIVRAVNSHDALVEALERTMFALEAAEACVNSWNGGRGSTGNAEGALAAGRSALSLARGQTPGASNG